MESSSVSGRGAYRPTAEELPSSRRYGFDLLYVLRTRHLDPGRRWSVREEELLLCRLEQACVHGRPRQAMARLRWLGPPRSDPDPPPTLPTFASGTPLTSAPGLRLLVSRARTKRSVLPHSPAESRIRLRWKGASHRAPRI